jgi:hypothetical protein
VRRAVVLGVWKEKLHNEELYNIYSSHLLIRMMKLKMGL